MERIPEHRLQEVREAMMTTFSRPQADELELLTGGLSSALVYKMTIAGAAYVLRIIMSFDELNNPERQFECMKRAAAAGLAPEVHYANAATGISITAYISKMALHDAFPSRIRLINELAWRVRQLHCLPPFPKLVDFIAGVEIFRSTFRELKMFPPEVTETCFKLYEKVVRNYPRDPSDMVASHNDLNPNNILFDGKKLWIIDWEAAFLNDRYVDLAILSQFFVSNEQEEEELLSCYFSGGIDAVKRARFFLMQQVCYMYYAMIMLRMAAAHHPPGYVHDPDMSMPGLPELRAKIAQGEIAMTSYEGQLKFGKTLLGTLEKQLKSPRFSRSLKVLKQANGYAERLSCG